MPIAPIITFKAGLCDFDTSSNPPKIKPRPAQGYIYLYAGDDELLHFCWRPRSAPPDQPGVDLIMFPADGSFTPYKEVSAENPNPANKATDGRIYLLRFASSSQRHLFWLQSGSQHPQKDKSWFSARDLKLGQIVNTLLQGDEVDVTEEMNSLPNGYQGPGGDDDESMEDVEGTNHDTDHQRGGSGGAGPGATGGDIREEGEQSREGGADGGRATAAGPLDATSIIQNFINSMPGGGQQQQQQAQGKIFTTLQDLLTTASTIPWIDSDTVDEEAADSLLQFLPPQLLSLAARANNPDMDGEIDEETEKALVSTLSLDQKKTILSRVLRSPQFTQSLASLTIALRDGGLPTVSAALNIPVKNNGYMRRGGVPLGGGEAVEAFMDGVKDVVKKEQEGTGEGGDEMDTQ